MFEILLFFALSSIIGLMFLFFGYAAFRILLPIWAFLVGADFGVTGMTGLFGSGLIPVSLGLIIGFAIGVGLALIVWYVYALAVYLFGITTGYALGAGLMMALGINSGIIIAVVGIAGAIGVTLLFAFTKMPKFMIIFLTAIAGAMAVIMGVLVLFGQDPALAGNLQLTAYVVSGSLFWIIIWAILSGVGIAFQYANLAIVGHTTSAQLQETYMWETVQPI